MICVSPKLWLTVFCLIQATLLFAQDKSASSIRVSCLGRLVPGNEITLIEVPYFTQEPPIVQELLVKEGDRVKKDQALARTHHFAIAKAMMEESEAALMVSQKSLELIKAGAEPTVVDAQEAQAKSMMAEAELEKNLYERRVELEKDKAISKEELDTARLKSELARSNMLQADKTLLSLTVVQKEKLALAQAEVMQSSAALARSVAMLELTEIKSPLNAMILRIHAYPGEKAEKNGLLELGDVEHMQVEAEVYVSDIRQVSVGQKAEIRSEAFEGALSARVTAIDPLVRPNRFVDLNPQSIRENRVVKVRLAIDAPAAVEKLSGAEVSVVINP